MYHHRASHGPVEVAFTDRYGGVSRPPYDELNLGVNTTDRPGSIEENHRRLLADFAPDAELADMRQVHGSTVVEVDRPGRAGDCDALVSRRRDVVLMVRVADCVPVLLADPDAGVVGVAHAGRQGLAAGVVPATVERMRQVGADQVVAWVGPRVCGRCYEVPAAMQQEVSAVEPASRSTTAWGSPALDIGAGALEQLRRAGVAEIVDVAACTRESGSLYSHRRDGRDAGRFAGVVRIRP